MVALVWRVAQEAVRNASGTRAPPTWRWWCAARAPGGAEVTDDGVGFDPTRRPTRPGYGLRGLQSLVADSGGHLEVRSLPGQGTTVRLEVDDDDPGRDRGRPRGAAQRARAAARREPTTSRWSARPRTAARRSSWCAATAPDVVLMDLQMPGRRRGQRDPARSSRETSCADVLVLTSFSDAERIVAALDAGAVGYLLKDADPDEVLDGIRAVSPRRVADPPAGGPRAARRPPTTARRAADS